MLKATEEDVLQIFKAVHGDLGRCEAVIIHDDKYNVIAVACFKDGLECWRATMAELAFDYMLLRANVNSKI